MTPQVNHYEVLLFKNSHFARRQFCDKVNCNRTRRSVEQQLQRACWNGLMLQLLPDVLMHPSGRRSIHTWEVIPAENFVEVRVGEVPRSVEYTRSVNPYYFLFETNFN
ncbi:MAG TPA: hypothetical protein VFP87_06540 [Chitinophagaceae bacterium]|nr:hypothetical protein [Chitinophagaceae bacterium]